MDISPTDGGWLVTLDDTEIQILSEAMERSRPYEDMPGLYRISAQIRADLNSAVGVLLQKIEKKNGS